MPYRTTVGLVAALVALSARPPYAYGERATRDAASIPRGAPGGTTGMRAAWTSRPPDPGLVYGPERPQLWRVLQIAGLEGANAFMPLRWVAAASRDLPAERSGPRAKPVGRDPRHALRRVVGGVLGVLLTGLAASASMVPMDQVGPQPRSVERDLLGEVDSSGTAVSSHRPAPRRT